MSCSKPQMQGPEDVFMQRFKQLKRRQPPPDYRSVLDLHDPECVSVASGKVKKFLLHNDEESLQIPRGLTSPEDWQVYEITSVPGALVLCNPFRPEMKKYLVARCLADYPRQPNMTNLDAHGDRKYEDIWAEATGSPDNRGRREYLQRLRWATLGYHYDWTHKVYRRTEHSEFPKDLACLSRYLVHAILGSQVRFKAEAAIVNFYHSDSSLSGHTDHSEFDLTAPLISISFGLPCVFMIGGQTKASEPVSLYLQDGDVVIMSGQSRMSYHAVPRILPLTHLPTQNNSQQPLSKSPIKRQQKQTEEVGVVCKRCRLDCEGRIPESALMERLQVEEYWAPFKEYISNNRININIRQVFHPGKTPADYDWPEYDTWKPP